MYTDSQDVPSYQSCVQEPINHQQQQQHQPLINKEAPHCVTCLCLSSSKYDCMYREPCFPRCGLQSGYDYEEEEEEEEGEEEDKDYLAVKQQEQDEIAILQDTSRKSLGESVRRKGKRQPLSSRTTTVDELLREMKLTSTIQSEVEVEGEKETPLLGSTAGYDRLSLRADKNPGIQAVSTNDVDKASCSGGTTTNSAVDGTRRRLQLPQRRRRRRPQQQQRQQPHHRRPNASGAHYNDDGTRPLAEADDDDDDETAREERRRRRQRRTTRSCDRGWPTKSSDTDQRLLMRDDQDIMVTAIGDLGNDIANGRAEFEAYYALKSRNKWQSAARDKTSILLGAGDDGCSAIMEGQDTRRNDEEEYTDTLLIEAKKFTSKPHLDFLDRSNDYIDESNVKSVDDANVRDLKLVRWEFIERIYEEARKLHRLQRHLDSRASTPPPQLALTRSVSTMTSARLRSSQSQILPPATVKRS